MLIHVGYHKTGTTWLQDVYFKQHPNMIRLADHEKIFNDILEPGDLRFSPRENMHYYKKDISKIHGNHKTPYISSETLCGSPFAGGKDSYRNAERLKSIFQEAKILLVIRNQVEAITSTYKQYVLGGGVGSLRQFLHPPKAYSYSWFSEDHFKYIDLILYYIKLFGMSNIKVMLYENFKLNNEKFCEELSCFAGVDYHPFVAPTKKILHKSYSDTSIALLRRANRFYRTPSNPWPVLDIPRIRKISMSLLRKLDERSNLDNSTIECYVENEYAGRFESSNREIENLLSIDLKKLGYQ